MFENIPPDLMERFNQFYKTGNILCFKIREDDNFKTESIYYEYFNVLGVLDKTTDLKENISLIYDYYLLVGDIKVLLEKSRWFKNLNEEFEVINDER